MRSNDLKTKDALRQAMQQALRENDTEAFYASFDQMIDAIAEETRESYEQSIREITAENDSRVLAARGVRKLTSEENSYYKQLAEAMKSRKPEQAVANLDLVMPTTVFDAVFDDLRTRHPLLSKIGFIPTSGAIKMMMNTNSYQTAAWGQLCDDIVKELTSGFREVDTSLMKLSAFMPVCKAMLDLGPEWLDNYVRQVLYEALANGLEAGIVNGDGNEQPIGMTRQVGDGVSVVGGVYPKKETIAVNDLNPDTLGNLLSIIAIDPNGKMRQVRDLILVVSPADYFQRVMPATTVMAPDGTFRNDVLPYPITVIQSAALENGEAVLGMAYKYFAAAGASREGRIEYSDHYRFLEDERVYIIKTYANGMPMDNNAFLRLDISGLAPAAYRVEMVESRGASNIAALSSLKIGALSLTPAFASGTDTYSATTTDASNRITAVPSDAGARVDIEIGGKAVPNGSAYAWADGANTVTVKVTAEDGTTTQTYTVTVNK